MPLTQLVSEAVLVLIMSSKYLSMFICENQYVDDIVTNTSFPHAGPERNNNSFVILY